MDVINAVTKVLYPEVAKDVYKRQMDIGLEEVETAANLVQEAAHPDANIIFGAAFDESLEDEIRVTVIATGFDQAPNSVPTAPSAAGERPAVQAPVSYTHLPSVLEAVEHRHCQP